MFNSSCSRRTWLSSTAHGLGAIALGAMLQPRLFARRLPGLPHHRPRAKRVIFLAQSGAPSQLDLFDHKPELETRNGDELPDSVRMGQRLTTMTSEQSSKPIAPSPFKFRKHGKSEAAISELLPYTATVADELCIVRSMYTDAINHDPAMTLLQTGTPFSGHPSIGAWISYGL